MKQAQNPAATENGKSHSLTKSNIKVNVNKVSNKINHNQSSIFLDIIAISDDGIPMIHYTECFIILNVYTSKKNIISH